MPDYAAERRSRHRYLVTWIREVGRLERRQRDGDRTIATRSALDAAKGKVAEAERNLRELDELERRQGERRRRG
jgi:hypothetical protein